MIVRGRTSSAAPAQVLNGSIAQNVHTEASRNINRRSTVVQRTVSIARSRIRASERGNRQDEVVRHMESTELAGINGRSESGFRLREKGPEISGEKGGVLCGSRGCERRFKRQGIVDEEVGGDNLRLHDDRSRSRFRASRRRRSPDQHIPGTNGGVSSCLDQTQTSAREPNKESHST